MSQRQLLGIFIFLVASLLAGKVMASDLAGKAGQIFSKVETELKLLKRENKLQSGELRQLVNNTLLPHIDNKYFTYKVLGKHLEKMSAEQRVEFVELLTVELIGNYAESLKRYNNESISVGASTIAPSGKLATLAMKFSGQDKPINAMTKWRLSDKDNSWYIYDFVVEGVSLLQTKQKEIAHQLSSIGIDGTIVNLKLKSTKE